MRSEDPGEDRQGEMTIHSLDCPYCGEPVEVALEADVGGEMVWDCEVCCRPWRLTVRDAGDGRSVEAHTLDE